MAYPVELKSILLKIKDRDIKQRNNLRKGLEKLEVNVLRLKDRELDKLKKVLTDEEIKTHSVANQTALRRIQRSVALGGTNELPPATWGVLKTIQNMIYDEKGDSSTYHLGHADVSVFGANLALLDKFLTFSDRTEGVERRRLLSEVMLISATIDRMSEEVANEITNGKVHDLSNEELADVLLVASLPSNKITIKGSKDFIANLSGSQVKGRVIVEIEHGESNVAKGNLTSLLSKQFGSFWGNIYKKRKTPFGKKMEKAFKGIDVTQIHQSPTFMNDLGEYLDDVWKGKKVRVYKQKKVRVSGRSRAGRAQKTLRARVRKKNLALTAYLNAKAKHKKYIMPTISLKALINQSLAEFIRLRMARSTAVASDKYLRNQTGTFSESAMLLTLNRLETGAYFGVYTYQKEPYSIFEPPSGKLSSPGRDPRLYVEGAIRDLASTILKRQFAGMALESK